MSSGMPPRRRKPCRWWWQRMFCKPRVVMVRLMHDRCVWCGYDWDWFPERDKDSL